MIDVNGVGYGLHIPLSTYARLGEVESDQEIYTYLYVRDDAMRLYGFATEEERQVFELLLSVTGVGPRMALGILSTLSVDEFRQAVNSEDVSLLMTIPGVGKKTSQKILFHLQDKITSEDGFEPMARMSEVDSEVLSALVALGYSVVEAQAAIQAIPRDAPEDVESRLRLSLAYFS